MLTVRTRSKVAADGTVTVPVGTDDVGIEVDVTITPVVTRNIAKDITQEEWVELLKRTAGSIDDPTFVRPEQLSLKPAPEFD